MNAVAKNLKRLRTRQGMTQEELAERLHVTRQAVSNWETAKTQSDIETLMVLAEALGTDANELLYGPRPAGEPCYARYQKKHVICAAVCAVLVLVWLLMEIRLVPYLKRLQNATFETRPILIYNTVCTTTGSFCSGCPAAGSGLAVGGHPPAGSLAPPERGAGRHVVCRMVSSLAVLFFCVLPACFANFDAYIGYE